MTIYIVKNCSGIYKGNIFIQGSWGSKLCTKFKNLCRPSRAQKADTIIPPPSKRIKSSPAIPVLAVQSGSDTAQYDKHVSFIQRSFQSKKWSMPSMLTLLEETAEQQRSWISDETPSVTEVLENSLVFLILEL